VKLDDLPPHVQAKARKLLAAQHAPPPAVTPARPAFTGRRVHGSVAWRDGDTLWLSLAVAPRTKKNHGRTVVTPSVAYARFEHHVREQLRDVVDALGLPLPDRRYNCAARFLVDNDRADTLGLMQGLADALQKARVVTDDRWLWTWDGTTQELAQLTPGVTLTIEPLPDLTRTREVA
jgi:hypothetical protein